MNLIQTCSKYLTVRLFTYVNIFNYRYIFCLQDMGGQWQELNSMLQSAEDILRLSHDRLEVVNLQTVDSPELVRQLQCAEVSLQCAEVSLQCAEVSLQCAEVSLQCAEVSLQCAEVSLQCAEVSLQCAEVSLQCAEVSLQCAEVSLQCAEVSLQCAEVSLQCAEVSLQCAEVSLQCAEVSLQCDEVSLWCAEVSLQCAEVSLQCAEVSLQCAEVSLQCAEVSLQCVEVSLQCAEVSLQCAEVSLQCAEVSLQCAEVSLQCAEVSLQCAEVSLQCAEVSLQTPVEGRKEMFYLMTHSTHFIYGYMASDIWLRTILIVRKETCCRHMGYSYQLTARVLLYAPSHRQDSTYHGLCYTSRGALAETRNSSMGSPHEGLIQQPIAPVTPVDVLNSLILIASIILILQMSVEVVKLLHR